MLGGGAMSHSNLRDICFDCTDQHRIARFWAGVLGYTVRAPRPEDDGTDPICIEALGSGMRIWFSPVPEPKIAKNRVHIDINMPDSAELDRLVSLGASVITEIRGDDGTLWWTVMADPEGNEFCAFPPA